MVGNIWWISRILKFGDFQSPKFPKSGYIYRPPPVSWKVGAWKVSTEILGNSLFFSEVAIWKVRVPWKVFQLAAGLSKRHAGSCAIWKVFGWAFLAWNAGIRRSGREVAIWKVRVSWKVSAVPGKTFQMARELILSMTRGGGRYVLCGARIGPLRNHPHCRPSRADLHSCWGRGLSQWPPSIHITAITAYLIRTPNQSNQCPGGGGGDRLGYNIVGGLTEFDLSGSIFRLGNANLILSVLSCARTLRQGPGSCNVFRARPMRAARLWGAALPAARLLCGGARGVARPQVHTLRIAVLVVVHPPPAPLYK